MKRNKTFFITVITLIIASLTALSGIMFAIASNNGESKPHITNENTFDLSANSTVIEDSPTPQTEMQEKFYSMYSIDESTNTITVISEEYLKDFWHSNYQSEVIHTLTVDEVMFIIQDSVRLYFE